MTDSEYTHIVLVVDKSGSMGYQGFYRDVEVSINKFLEDQKSVPGFATVTLVQFDTDVHVLTDFATLDSVGPYTLSPFGATALNDAWGQTIVDVGRKLSSLPEDKRPGHVIFVVATDGEENSSREYSASQIKELVEQQQSVYGWNFVFLAANQDACLTGSRYGLNTGNTMTFSTNPVAMANTGHILSNYSTATRGGGTYVFTDADRKAASQS